MLKKRFFTAVLVAILTLGSLAFIACDDNADSSGGRVPEELSGTWFTERDFNWASSKFSFGYNSWGVFEITDRDLRQAHFVEGGNGRLALLKTHDEGAIGSARYVLTEDNAGVRAVIFTEIEGAATIFFEDGRTYYSPRSGQLCLELINKLSLRATGNY